MILIKQTKKMGRGVFTRLDINKGTKNCVNEILKVKLKPDEEILNSERYE